MRLQRKRKPGKSPQQPKPSQPLKKKRRKKYVPKEKSVTIEKTPDVQPKRTKQVGKSLKDPFVELPATTPQLPKRRSKRLSEVIGVPCALGNNVEQFPLEPWVEVCDYLFLNTPCIYLHTY